MIEGTKTSEFLLVAAVIVLGYAFGRDDSTAMVAAGSAIGAGLYALGRGIAKRGA